MFTIQFYLQCAQIMMNNILTSGGLNNFVIDELAIFVVLVSPEKFQDRYTQVIENVTIVDISTKGLQIKSHVPKKVKDLTKFLFQEILDCLLSLLILFNVTNDFFLEYTFENKAKSEL